VLLIKIGDVGTFPFRSAEILRDSLKERQTERQRESGAARDRLQANREFIEAVSVVALAPSVRPSVDVISIANQTHHQL